MNGQTDGSIFLETPRLILRRFEDADADARLLHELDADPEVMRYIGPYALPSLEAYREKIHSVFQSLYAAHPARGCWAAELKPGRPFIGWFFLRPAIACRFAAEMGWTCATEVELGYRLHRSAWGQGLASEAARALVARAFNDPAVTAVVSCALVANRASTRVMEKAGMTWMRTAIRAGESEEDVIYSISR